MREDLAYIIQKEALDNGLHQMPMYLAFAIADAIIEYLVKHIKVEEER